MEPSPQNHFLDGPLEGLGWKPSRVLRKCNQQFHHGTLIHDSSANVLQLGCRDRKGIKITEEKF